METKGENKPKPEKQKYSVIVNAVIVKDGKILLSQRGLREKHGAGKWSIPGGKIEAIGEVYEVLQETAKREALEETGVEVKDEMHLIANNTFQHNEDKLQVLAVVFLCFWKSGEPKPLEDTEDVKWTSKNELGSFDFHSPDVRDYVLKGFNFLEHNEE